MSEINADSDPRNLVAVSLATFVLELGTKQSRKPKGLAAKFRRQIVSQRTLGQYLTQPLGLK